MTSFTHDTAPTQYAEGGGIRFAYRRFGMRGRPPLVFFQHFMGTLDDHDPALSDAFASYTAAIVHHLDAGSVANVDGDSNYVRVQVLTNAGALDRDKQLAVVGQLTDIIATAAGDPTWPTGTGCC